MVIGLALSLGITRVINFTHGEAIMLGAYGAYWALALFGIDPLIALPGLVILGTIAGYIVFRVRDRAGARRPAGEPDTAHVRHRPRAAERRAHPVDRQRALDQPRLIRSPRLNLAIS